MTETTGFIGLGIMGRPMAENLAKAHPVLGYDPQPGRFEGIRGVTRATGVEELARSCRVVCLSLPSAEVVEAVALGPRGLAASLSPGSLVIDLSTGLPSVSRKIASELAQRQIAYLDAPVSGGEAGAVSGGLAIMVGSSPAAFAQALPYLNLLGTSVIRVGEVGAGNVAKLVNNMVVGVTFSVVAEGFALAVDNGLDPDQLYRAIKDGWAGSKVLDVSAPAIAARRYTPGGTVDMIRKDLGYARIVAAESSVAIPMTSAAHEVFVAAQALGRGAQSQPAIFELWQQRKEES